MCYWWLLRWTAQLENISIIPEISFTQSQRTAWTFPGAQGLVPHLGKTPESQALLKSRYRADVEGGRRDGGGASSPEVIAGPSLKPKRALGRVGFKGSALPLAHLRFSVRPALSLDLSVPFSKMKDDTK